MRLYILVIFISISTSIFASELNIKTSSSEHKKYQSDYFFESYKPSYFLPFTYNSGISNAMIDEVESDPVEISFQFSFKAPIIEGIFDEQLSLYFGYTQASFWQAYNTEYSSPFRETNYEPEIFALWDQSIALPYDWSFNRGTLNFVHQSNGQKGDLSKSWNRIETNLYLQKDNFSLIASFWLRVPEPNVDDNPDILNFLGHGQLMGIYKFNGKSITITMRNNLESNFKRGSTNIAFSYPIHKKLRGYIKLFSGYGNSLAEYNKYTNSVGIGFLIANW